MNEITLESPELVVVARKALAVRIPDLKFCSWNTVLVPDNPETMQIVLETLSSMGCRWSWIDIVEDEYA